MGKGRDKRKKKQKQHDNHKAKYAAQPAADKPKERAA